MRDQLQDPVSYSGQSFMNHVKHSERSQIHGVSSVTSWLLVLSETLDTETLVTSRY